MKSILLLLAIVILCPMNADANTPSEIIAHRGASGDAPENTLAAFRVGYRQGADGCELDIHLSKDGHVVVVHDASTKRTAGVDRRVADQTLAELQAMEVGQFGQWAGKGFVEHLPALDEVLAIVPAGKKIWIEIKCGVEILPALKASLEKAHLAAKQTPVVCFNIDVCKAVKEHLPQLHVYLLHSYRKIATTGEYPTLDEVVGLAKAAKLDGIDIEHTFPLDGPAVARAHDAELKLFVWTLDDPVKARSLLKAGVDGITTNVPARLVAWLKKADAE